MEDKQEMQTIDESKPVKNVVILAMSTLAIINNRDEKGNITERGLLGQNKFSYEEKEEKEGKIYYSQLEPISRMIKEKEGSLDHVVILATNETLNPPEKPQKKEEAKIQERFIYDNNPYTSSSGIDDETLQIKQNSIERIWISAVDFYKKRLGFWDENDDRVETVPFDIKNSKELNDAIFTVVEIIRDMWSTAKKEGISPKLWIDTQGSVRGASLSMNVIVSILKNEGITPDGVYYVNFIRGAELQEIKSEKETYQIFDFASGMNEFTKTGRAEQLLEYYRRKIPKKEQKKNVPSIIFRMYKISSAILMCDVPEFKRNLKEIKNDLIKSEGKDPLLDIFLNNIRNDYGKLASDKYSEVDVINWLYNKKLYQLTLTYIESQMPEWWNKKYFEYDIINGDALENAIHKHETESNFILNTLMRNICGDEGQNCGDNNGYAEDLEKLKRNITKYYEKLKEMRDDHGNIPVSVIESNDKNESVKTRICNLRICADKDELVFSCMYIHYILKIIRNTFNHLSERMISEVKLKAIITYFKQLCEELEGLE